MTPSASPPAHLPADRCQGVYDRRVCDRAEQCARHLALRTDPKQRYVNCAALLCYPGYTFFVAAPEAHDGQN